MNINNVNTIKSKQKRSMTVEQLKLNKIFKIFSQDLKRDLKIKIITFFSAMILHQASSVIDF